MVKNVCPKTVFKNHGVWLLGYCDRRRISLVPGTGLSTCTFECERPIFGHSWKRNLKRNFSADFHWRVYSKSP